MKSAVDILSELVAIPSVNPMGGSVDPATCFEGRMSDWLEQFFHSLEVDCERIEVTPGRDNVLARYESGTSGKTLLLDAHQDTVPTAGMTIDPFRAEIRDGRLYGRGACDVKGGMAAMLYAFGRLVRERPPGAANVVLSCTCDEEATTTGIRDLISYWSSAAGKSSLVRSPPDAAIVAEPTSMDVVVAHRGVTRFRIRTKGRACHSSDPTQGINAIYRMGQVTSALSAYADSLSAKVPPHALCGEATLSVGRIAGGTSVNIVPDECVIEVDRRVIPGEDRGAVVADIQKYLEEQIPFELEFDPPWVESPALTDDDNARLAGHLLECVKPVSGSGRAVGVPYGTHASRTCAAGVPSVVFGPGSIAQAHTEDEFIEIKQLEQAAEIYFRACATSDRL